MEQTPNHLRVSTFDELIEQIRMRLWPALLARWGVEVGSDTCSEVEEYAWEHRTKVLRTENQIGYLYRVAQSKARRYNRWMKRTTFPSRFPDVVHEDTSVHDVLQHLSGLNDDQRVCILLIHGFCWSYAEVAEILGVSRSVVNNNVHRGLAHLRGTDWRDPLLNPAPDRLYFTSEETR